MARAQSKLPPLCSFHCIAVSVLAGQSVMSHLFPVRGGVGGGVPFKSATDLHFMYFFFLSQVCVLLLTGNLFAFKTMSPLIV